uniref:Uncharacterized protein n=1 Tax=viral metagenome TaxID=1070528 RepID=A0A6C0K130_9ZZZZ
MDGFADLPNFSLPSQDLSKNANFMTFLQFHQQVCTVWNEVIEDIMKNDQVSQPVEERLPRAQFVLNLQKDYSTTASFVGCQAFDQTSTLSVLLASIPETTKVYKDTFAFLNKNITDTLEKLESALNSANVSVSAFADYREGFEDCTAAVAAATAKATAAAKTEPAVKDLSKQQQDQTNKVLARVQTILVEQGTLQSQLQVVMAGYQKLKDYKKQGEDGTIYQNVS